MIVGHQKQREMLREAQKNHSLAHAYLFSGPEKIGKKEVAWELAQRVFCQNPSQSGPCGSCQSCRLLASKNHPDFIFLAPAEGERVEIGALRNLISQLSLRPALSQTKMAIIDNAHLLNVQAQNCFLKTLEEPPGQTIIILITHQREALLPTVLSRLREIKFSYVSLKEAEALLADYENKRFSKEDLKRLYSGRPGEVIDFLRGKGELSLAPEFFAKLEEILAADMAKRFQEAEKMAEDHPSLLLTAWLKYFRWRWLEDLASGRQSLLPARIKALQKAIFLLDHYYVNKRLVLENLMLEI